MCLIASNPSPKEPEPVQRRIDSTQYLPISMSSPAFLTESRKSTLHDSPWSLNRPASHPVQGKRGDSLSASQPSPPSDPTSGPSGQAVARQLQFELGLSPVSSSSHWNRAGCEYSLPTWPWTVPPDEGDVDLQRKVRPATSLALSLMCDTVRTSDGVRCL